MTADQKIEILAQRLWDIDPASQSMDYWRDEAAGILAKLDALGGIPTQGKVRVGRHRPNHLYRQVSNNPDDADLEIGVMFTDADGIMAAKAINHWQAEHCSGSDVLGALREALWEASEWMKRSAVDKYAKLKPEDALYFAYEMQRILRDMVPKRSSDG